MHRLSGLLILLAIATSFALASGSRAAVVKHFDLAALSENADVIVHAKVSSESAAWNQGLTKIWTTYGLQLKETLKGEFVAGAQASIRGGQVGRKAQAVSGEAKLQKGKEYLLFLWKDANNRYRMVGMAQGAFLITTKDEVSTARNSTRGLTLVGLKGKVVAEKTGPIKGELSALITQIKALLPAKVEEEIAEEKEAK